MKLHVHIGVHKTASTFLQNCLEQDQAELNGQGVGLMPLAQFRQFMTGQLLRRTPGKFKIQHHLGKFFAGEKPTDIRGLILSDENLLGRCSDFVDAGKPYQAANARLDHLRQLLDGHDITLFVGVRAYDTYIPSIYCEALRTNRQFASFEPFRERLDFEATRWPALIQGFVDAVKPTAVRLWRYEDFRPNWKQIYSALAFDAKFEDFDKERKELRASFSALAIDVLGAISQQFGPDVADRLLHGVGTHLPKAEGFEPFYPWDDATKERLSKWYEEDCAALPSDWWLVAPGARPEPEPISAQIVIADAAECVCPVETPQPEVSSPAIVEMAVTETFKMPKRSWFAPFGLRVGRETAQSRRAPTP